MITPNNITTLEPNQIFVFGSNLAGRHGKGAARVALEKFGAIYGQGIGLMGCSYGIPTKGMKMEVLPLVEIDMHVKNFLAFAKDNPQFIFLVTEIGCGLAGYKPSDIAPMFGPIVTLPLNINNVSLPQSFWECLIVK